MPFWWPSFQGAHERKSVAQKQLAVINLSGFPPRQGLAMAPRGTSQMMRPGSTGTSRLPRME